VTGEPRPGDVASFSFDLSALVRRSVATLYSHLVTRPTGRAIRVGIESQLQELGGPALSVLDFSQVVVLDYSCADETVAKLLCRYRGDDRPADIFFLASGVAERHRDPIEQVLLRHGLALVVQLEQGEAALLGEVAEGQRAAWAALERAGRAAPEDIAAATGAGAPETRAALDALAARRVILRTSAGTCMALTALLRGGGGGGGGPSDSGMAG
jgi:hypothetical protein